MVKKHNFTYPRHELLLVVETVAREKNIEKEKVFLAMEEAFERIAHSKYGLDNTIEVTIDRTSGNMDIKRCLVVVETVESSNAEISLAEALLYQEDVKCGEIIKIPLPPLELGRTVAQSVRQVIVQKVWEAEREKQYEEFANRKDQIISGIVKRVEFGNVTVDLGRAEAILRREEIIPRETFRVGDRIRVYIADVDPNLKGPMIILSRTHPRFMARLFEQEVPEIYDGIIEIKAVARDPGSRAKIAVFTMDGNIDPVGACVGIRGSRVQTVVTELQSEKVDIIPWSANPATFVVNALAPAEVVKVVIDEDRNRIEVIVDAEQLSLAIGRRGQNVRLASKLTGWDIDIVTADEDSKRRTQSHSSRVEIFMHALDVDEMIAQLLVAEDFASIEEIAGASISDLSSIEGFDDEIAQELLNRANNYLINVGAEQKNNAKDLGADTELLALEIPSSLLMTLVKNNIKTRDDFADLAIDELLELDSSVTKEQASEWIMKAREHWFKDVTHDNR